MKTPTYQAYRTDPKVREQIEREVRRMRAEAVHQYFVMPIKRLFARRPSRPTVLIVRAA